MPVIPIAAAVLPSVIGGIASAAKGSGPGVSAQGNINMAKQNWDQYDPNRQDIQGANIDTSGAQPFVGAQKNLMGQLQNQAAGQGPTLAEAQLQKGTQNNLASMLAATAAQRGNQNPGVMQQNLLGQLANANQQAAGQAAEARAGEQLDAQQQLGSLALGGAGQQYQEGQAQAGFNQQASLANQKAQALAQQQWNQAVAGLTSQGQAGQNQLASQDNQTSNNWQTAALGAAGTGLGGLGALASGSSSAPSYSNAGAEAAGANYGLTGHAEGGLLLGPGIAGEAGPEFAIPAQAKNDMDLAARLGPGGVTLLHQRVSKLEEAMQRMRGAGRI